MNFRNIIKVITSLDNTISNNIVIVASDPKNVPMLKELFRYKKVDESHGIQKKLKFDKYVYDTFNCFANYKQEIILQVPYIDRFVDDKELLKLFLYELRKKKQSDKVFSYHIMDEDNKNLFKRELLTIFPNVKRVIIHTTDYNRINVYTISLLSLLSIINGTSVVYVEIKDYGNVWLGKMLSESSLSYIIDKYKEENFSLTFNVTDEYASVIIEKKF